MTVTWTSGYGMDEADPFVEWGRQGEEERRHSPAVTLTFDRNSMCGMFSSQFHKNSYDTPDFACDDAFPDEKHSYFVAAPARTVGWRDPGFIHTSFLKELSPNSGYVICYKARST